MASNNVHRLLGQNPSSDQLSEYVTLLSNAPHANSGPVEVKSYSDAVYFNHFNTGLSFQFAPKDGYRPAPGAKQSDLENEKLALDSIFLYNVPGETKTDTTSKSTSPRSTELAFSTFPALPLVLQLNPDAKDKDGNLLQRPAHIEITEESSGKDFIAILGEPDRKGGGAGPSSGSIGIWCEWTQDGIMVEFGGDEAKGPQAWERGKDAVWKILTVFSRS